MLAAFAIASPIWAASDGYLRQTAPTQLRFAKLLPPPPPVNELILALDKPPTSAAPNADEAGGKSNETPTYLDPVIDNLIRVPAPLRTRVVVDTDNPTNTAASAGLKDPDPPMNDIPVVPGVDPLPQEDSQVEAAKNWVDILKIFNQNTAQRRRDNQGTSSTVVVTPPVFLPPQPAASAPPSRSVYRSP